MKVIKIILLFSITLTANNTLIEKAKSLGLQAIPQDKKELNKIIDPKGVITPQRVELGKKLYFDPRLSKSSLISCNWCHNLGLAGVDGVSIAVGHKWAKNPHGLNSPTVYNAVLAKRQFWDGRSLTLEDQAKGPIQAKEEMAISPKMLKDRILSIPEYVKDFKDAYGADVKINLDSVALAIATFERTLVTPSRFDDFLNGDTSALNKDEQDGLNVFLDKGCVACHQGMALGGELRPFELAGKYKFRDVGDFLKNDMMVKVPTLRNITLTAPYFHNGQVWELSEAIKEMGRIQVGYKANLNATNAKDLNLKLIPIKFKDKEIDKIIKFFKTLEGRMPKIDYPQLPKSQDTASCSATK
jgi:cytochrome c peroxidase